MRAAAIAALPDGRGWIFQPKWDGWRAVAWRCDDGRVLLHSRHQRDLRPYFPDVVLHLAQWLPAGTVLDGELVSWDPARGRTDFAALGRRITAGRTLAAEVAAHPAHLVAFDCLADSGTVLLRRPLAARAAHLRQLLDGAPPALSLCAQTMDAGEARTWMADYAPAGLEGIVAKPAAGLYTPGRAGWGKRKLRRTAEAIVAGATGSVAAPVSLLLGRLDAGGRLRYVGRTHRLGAQQRTALDGVLRPVARGVWPQPLPASWAGDLTERRPLPYLPVEPLIAVEVDVAYEHGRWRHPLRYVRTRPDLDPAVLPLWSLDAGYAA